MMSTEHFKWEQKKEEMFMRKTKKLIALSTAALMAFMTGCSGTPAADPTTGTTVATGETQPADQTEETGEAAAGNRVTDGEGWYLWDEAGNLTLEGRGADGTTAVVSSGKYEASQAGLEVLQAGGNAVDAAIAVSFALGVTEPNSSGIGGGGFMTIHSAAGEDIFVNFRETAPMAATPEMWQLDAEGNVIGDQKAIGGKSVGIPGNVKGMEYAFETYGSGNVTWEEVLAPSINLAENGFIVTPTLYNDMAGTYDSMLNYPDFGNVYLDADGLNYQIGSTFKNPDLAKTLKAIAKDGADAFYTGPIAQKMVDTVNKYGGLFTMDDLANYEVKVMEPVQGTYRGYKIISSPLPSSGGTHVIEALNIMENFDMTSLGFDSAERLHIMSEAFKMCFNDRGQFMGDPDYVDVPVNGILSKERAKMLAGQIDPAKASNYEQIDPWQYEHEDTTHFSVADAEGNMVAVTQTVNGLFGAKIIPDGYGFVLNNEMDDFSADPTSPNSITGNKVPLSSMSPTIVLKEDGSPFMILGSPGATKIITTVAQVISNVIDYDMSMQEAIDAPRFYNNATSSIQYETRFTEENVKKLEELGNEIEAMDEFNRTFGSVNAVMYGEDGTLHGGADPRRDGKAVGY